MCGVSWRPSIAYGSTTEMAISETTIGLDAPPYFGAEQLEVVE